MIKENLDDVHRRIVEACRRSCRKPEDVTLIAVSKTHPASMIQECYTLGVREFGENKVQELLTKQEGGLPEDISWHMIGHLQRNKVRSIIGKTTLIHSVDSERLAEKIQEEAAKKGITQQVLLEVNVANEESKFGFKLEEVIPFLQKNQSFSNLDVVGLMTVAPYVANPEENRVIFATLRKLLVDINAKKVNNVTMSVLSMGMSNDYEIAIEEGATHVRVGTGIFGQRDYGSKR